MTILSPDNQIEVMTILANLGMRALFLNNGIVCYEEDFVWVIKFGDTVYVNSDEKGDEIYEFN